MHPIAKFHEEVSAKIPALTLLTNLGYTFIPPEQAAQMRDSVVLREVLAQQTFELQEQSYPLSSSAIDKMSISLPFHR